ncbi:ATP-binding response regulator [Serratia ficaria]|uniref:ATP-binding response regulator n=1 Tax=Serratia ficaria TaxID=61651 RepID=UPI00077CDB28|nr:hybrid sensor histidine kinase/response regulator [Serratia ficaria]
MKKKFFLILAGMAVTLTFVVSTVVKYDAMLKDKSFYAISGTQENYAWAIAKFSIQLSEFYSLVKTDGGDIDVIKQKLDILYSRVGVIREESESTKPLYNQEGYKEIIDSIYNKLKSVDSYINLPNPNTNKVIELVNQIEPDSKVLINIADHAEVSQRTTALEDFRGKRQGLIILLAIVTILIFAMFIIVAFQLYKTNKLLDAEKIAFNNKNAFLGVLGHELKTSLQAITSTIEVISLTCKSVELKQIERLENASMKMESQMKDLAEFAKVDNGNIEINRASFNLLKIVEDTVSECVSISNKKGVEVILGDVSDVFLKSDPYRVMQVVENLVTNAIKYTDKGVVKINSIVKQENTLVIEVEDSGRGIPKDKIKSIFSPFIRASDGDKTPGFGMGLAIVMGVVKAMGGSVEVKSELGKGSFFRVSIPVEMSSPQEIGLDSTAEAEVFLTSGINILIVDDNDLACESLASLLQSDFRVEFTTSPERALEKLYRKPYDLVLSDLQMPVMTGDELYMAVRDSSGPNRRTPFIFISAYDNDNPNGEVEILTKPVRLYEIRRSIERIFSRKSYI